MLRLSLVFFTLIITGCSPAGKSGSADGSAAGQQGGSASASPPLASFSYAPTTIYAGEKVEFDASGSQSLAGEIIAYSWDFDGDGGIDATGPLVSEIMSYSGDYDVTLTVTDSNGAQGISTQKLTVTVKLLQR